MGMMKEFKEFALKGNVMDLAVGVIIGAAFGKIVDSVVNDLIMPIVGKAIGGLDFSNYYLPLAGQPMDIGLEAAKKAGAVFAYGNFITIAINFVDPCVHHLHDRQADEPAAPRSADRGKDRRRRKTSCCCARSARA